jgi:UDP-glucose 4-epimerase
MPRFMRAIVTGGAGFIGSNLVDALVERGDEVTVVDNLATGKRENLTGALDRGAELVEESITDAAAMLSLAERVRPEAIFHFGAQIDVRKSAADPAWDASINVVGTINMLDVARVAGVRRFVNSSTGGAIYGEGQQIPAPETHPAVPEAPYGLSKWCAEQYCELQRRFHGVPAVSLRYGNVYGPRQDPLGEAGVIAIFCGKLLAGERPTIFGDGEQTRDYVYVDDVVSANLAALENPSAIGAYNVGTERASSVLDLVEVLRKLAGEGVGFDPEFAPPRKGEVQHIALDTTRAREELGWQAQVGLDEGLERTLASLR